MAAREQIAQEFWTLSNHDKGKYFGAEFANQLQQWEDVFCFVFGLEWIEILIESAKDQPKLRREMFVDQGVLSLGIKHHTKYKKDKICMLRQKSNQSPRILISRALTWSRGHVIVRARCWFICLETRSLL